MNIIARSIFVAFVSLLLSNCTPGMFLQFKNETNEEILLKYSLCDDLVIENTGKTFESIMAKDEIVDVIFSWNNLWNRGITKEDYKNKETFLSIFESIEIEKLNSNEKISEKDLENYGFEYIKEGVSGHLFILRIGIIPENNKEIKPLLLLETIDKKKYDIIIRQLPEDEIVKNYFYAIDGENYEIWYYEIFFEKYSGWRGDPTGKCFTIIFNNNEMVDTYNWR